MSAPNPQLRTSRLTLRLAEAADAAGLLDFYQRNSARFAAVDPRRSAEFYSLAHWQAHVAAARKEFDEGASLRLLMVPHDAPALVAGTINFTNIVRGYFQACYLGYSI